MSSTKSAIDRPTEIECSGCGAEVPIPAHSWDWKCKEGHENSGEISTCRVCDTRSASDNPSPAVRCTQCGSATTVPRSNTGKKLKEKVGGRGHKDSSGKKTKRIKKKKAPAQFHCKNCNNKLMLPTGPWVCYSCAAQNEQGSDGCVKCKQPFDSQNVICGVCQQSTKVPRSRFSDSLSASAKHIRSGLKKAVLKVTRKGYMKCPRCTQAIPISTIPHEAVIFQTSHGTASSLPSSSAPISSSSSSSLSSSSLSSSLSSSSLSSSSLSSSSSVPSSSFAGRDELRPDVGEGHNGGWRNKRSGEWRPKQRPSEEDKQIQGDEIRPAAAGGILHSEGEIRPEEKHQHGAFQPGERTFWDDETDRWQSEDDSRWKGWQPEHAGDTHTLACPTCHLQLSYFIPAGAARDHHDKHKHDKSSHAVPSSTTAGLESASHPTSSSSAAPRRDSGSYSTLGSNSGSSVDPKWSSGSSAPETGATLAQAVGLASGPASGIPIGNSTSFGSSSAPSSAPTTSFDSSSAPTISSSSAPISSAFGSSSAPTTSSFSSSSAPSSKASGSSSLFGKDATPSGSDLDSVSASGLSSGPISSLSHDSTSGLASSSSPASGSGLASTSPATSVAFTNSVAMIMGAGSSSISTLNDGRGPSRSSLDSGPLRASFSTSSLSTSSSSTSSEYPTGGGSSLAFSAVIPSTSSAIASGSSSAPASSAAPASSSIGSAPSSRRSRRTGRKTAGAPAS